MAHGMKKTIEFFFLILLFFLYFHYKFDCLKFNDIIFLVLKLSFLSLFP